jgi:Fis family transcriptional regulator
MSKERKSTAPATGVPEMRDQTLSECVRTSLSAYFDALDGHDTTDLYQMVLREVERPMFEAVLEHTGHNLSAAAQLLGISRGTFRKKLREHGIWENSNR